MTSPSIGPVIGSTEVEVAVLEQLRERLPFYISEVAKRRGVIPADVGLPIRPRTLASRLEFQGFPEDRLPAVQVVSNGDLEPPVRGDEGLFTRVFDVRVFCYVSARDASATRFLRGVYEEGIVLAVMQGRTLGGLAVSTEWLGGTADDVRLTEKSQRTVQGTVHVFGVMVDGCLDPGAGPAVFVPDDGSGYPGDLPPDVVVDEVLVTYVPVLGDFDV